VYKIRPNTFQPLKHTNTDIKESANINPFQVIFSPCLIRQCNF
jgi:hypothetical protein